MRPCEKDTEQAIERKMRAGRGGGEGAGEESWFADKQNDPIYIPV